MNEFLQWRSFHHHERVSTTMNEIFQIPYFDTHARCRSLRTRRMSKISIERKLTQLSISFGRKMGVWCQGAEKLRKSRKHIFWVVSIKKIATKRAPCESWERVESDTYIIYQNEMEMTPWDKVKTIPTNALINWKSRENLNSRNWSKCFIPSEGTQKMHQSKFWTQLYR